MTRDYRHGPEFYAKRIARLHAQIDRLEQQIVELAASEAAARVDELAAAQERAERARQQQEERDARAIRRELERQERIAQRKEARPHAPRIEQIRATIAEHPDWNLTEIGKHIGVTRERVRQLVNEHGIAVLRGHHKRPRNICGICDQPVSDRRAKRHLACGRTQAVCTGCGVTFTRCRSLERRRETNARYATTDRAFHSWACLQEWKQRNGGDWFVRRRPQDWGFGVKKAI